MHADLDLLLTAVARLTISCLRGQETPVAESQTRRSSRSASPRPSWASQATAAFWRWLAGGFRTCSLSCPSRATTSVAAGWRRRSTGSAASLPARARASTTTSCCSTRRRWSAAARSRPRGARNSPTPAATATAAPTRAFSGACACRASSPPTAHPGRSASSRSTRPEREVALELLPRALRCGEAVVCDKGYPSREFEHEVAQLEALVLRPARKDEPDNHLHLSSIRQRIESVFQTCKDILSSSATGRARCPTSGRGPRNASSRSRPASTSTTGSHAPAARSSPSWPERVESVI
jgi:hypothetical protein